MSKPAEKEPESPSQSEKKTAETEKDQTVIEQASGDTALSLVRFMIQNFMVIVLLDVRVLSFYDLVQNMELSAILFESDICNNIGLLSYFEILPLIHIIANFAEIYCKVYISLFVALLFLV